ncbi:acyltransferase family protein, partial [Mycobacterium alsense]|uniref:acyltransferase family protein n=1 Tax=Mycobacterium alsense TaxID=324058 RepID=UPI0013F4FA30
LQFYLVWPALIIGTTWLVRRVRRRAQADAPSLQRPYLVVLAIVGALSFAASLVLTQVLPPMAFFSLPTRAWELAAGGLVALTVGRWRRLPTWPAAAAGWAGLSLILLSCCYLSPNTPYPGSAALLPVLGTALVIGAGCAAPSQGCGRVLAISPMRAVGRVSYSWYLWHWPVLSIALWSFAPVMGHTLWLALAGILISLGFAVVTLRLIENPLRFANFARRSAMRSLALGGVATGVAVGVGIALQVPDPVGRGAPATALTVTAVDPPAGSDMNAYDVAVQHAFTQVQAAVAASAGLTAVPSNLEPPLAHAAFKGPLGGSKGCLRGLYQVGQPECASGDTNSPTTVALVGDSHAAMWYPAFEQIATQRHWRLETLAKAACPLLDLPTINSAVDRAYTECDQWRGQITARLRAEHPRLVVLSMRRAYRQPGITSYDPAWIDATKR